MIIEANCRSFLQKPGVILDVRSPSEYCQGHIPGAVNLPLFTDQERAIVGTAYKKEGKDKALELGLKFCGPKLVDYVNNAKGYLKHGYAKIHCWRGGMRSSAIAMLLYKIGMPIILLGGGYKAFRQWAHKLFAYPFKYSVLSGFTGCGKTSILHALNGRGEQIIDLEALAHHRGSSFGSLQMPDQPSTEQFQNDLAIQLAQFDPEKRIWVEDESRLIGTCHIPDPFFRLIKAAPFFVIDRPLQERLDNLMAVYGKANPQELIQATQRISKKLGGSKTKEVVALILEGRAKTVLEILLHYYDSSYRYALSKRALPAARYYEENLTEQQWAIKLLAI